MPYTPRFPDTVTMLRQVIERHPARPALGVREQDGWHWITYRELGERIDRCRAGLAARGVARGDRVALIANNRLEWAVAVYGAQGLGAATVAMYESQLDRDWKHILGDSGAKLCFVANEGIRERVRSFRDALPELQVVSLDGSDGDPDSFAALMKQGSERPVPEITPDPGDLVYLIYTSGTTGFPKGVELTHENVCANISALLEVIPLSHADRSLAFLPWAHVFGGSIELNSLLSLGASLAICESTQKVVDYLSEVRPTVLIAVPRVWNRIYDGVHKQIASKPQPVQRMFHVGMRAQSKAKRGEPLHLIERLALPLAKRLVFSKIVARFGGELRFAVSGAAALSPEVGEFIDNLGITIYEGYGMTEASGVVSTNSPLHDRPGSVGHPLPGVDVKIDTEVAGASEHATEGEIVVYGHGVMKGYHNLPEESAAVMTPDGGLRTGDMGYVDADGFLYITGRVKEIYKLENGKYVAPAPLEEKLTLSPYIAQVMIYGSDKPHNVALIVPDMDRLAEWAQTQQIAVRGKALIQHPRVRQLMQDELHKLSRDFRAYERVRDFTLIDEPFSVDNDTLTPTLKIKRRKVIERYRSQIEGLFRARAAE